MLIFIFIVIVKGETKISTSGLLEQNYQCTFLSDKAQWSYTYVNTFGLS